MGAGVQEKKTVYVAETDANGVIECVWIDAQGQRSVRPFNPRLHRFDVKAPAEFLGAASAAITSWLAMKQHEQSPK